MNLAERIAKKIVNILTKCSQFAFLVFFHLQNKKMSQKCNFVDFLHDECCHFKGLKLCG